MNYMNQNTTKYGLKNFWDNLQSELLLDYKLSQAETMDSMEKSFLFSMFFRNCTQIELHTYQTLLGIKSNCYLILLDFLLTDKLSETDYETAETPTPLYRFLKNKLQDKGTCHIGPYIANRYSILVSDNSNDTSAEEAKSRSIELSHYIMNEIHNEYGISVAIGIGSVNKIHTIYHSFIEALTCLRFRKPNQIIHISDYEFYKQDIKFDYSETEKHLMEAVRFRKPEAYDFFSMMINHISDFSEDIQRNKIFEILVLAIHAIRMDDPNLTDVFNYIGYMKELSDVSGKEITEWAYRKFIYITGYVKPLNSIDYSNKIVQTTKEFLESHYAEDISLEDMAAHVNISPQYFSKLIKKSTGFNFIDWLAILRVKKAKELLTDSSLTVKEVCFMVGYKDPNYFSRIFKKRLGITPSEYAKKNSI